METEKNGSIAMERTLCVTGANGFIGSWQVAQLLDQGFFVRGTVRNPENQEKNKHLWKLKGADDRLQLFKADVMDYDSIYRAVVGCEGVFHTACPVLAEMDDPQKDMIDPAAEGTRNVLEACAEAGIQRVIYVATYLNCMYTEDIDSSKVPDETWWSDSDFYAKLGVWYTVGKLKAERTAWEIAKEKGIDLITILPAVTFGPMLQNDINASNQILQGVFLSGDYFSDVALECTYVYFGPVDVRDVAASSILLYKTPSASGRYLCLEKLEPFSDTVQSIGKLYPGRNIRLRELATLAGVLHFTIKKLLDLGFVFRPFSETIADTLVDLEEKGFLPKLKSEQNTQYSVVNP